jgi:hypothetical protein
MEDELMTVGFSAQEREVLRSRRKSEVREEVRGYVLMAIALAVFGGTLLPLDDTATGLLRFDKESLSADAVPTTATSAAGIFLVFHLVRKAFQCWSEERELRRQRLRLELYPRYVLHSSQGVQQTLSIVEHGPTKPDSQEAGGQLPLFDPSSWWEPKTLSEPQN